MGFDVGGVLTFGVEREETVKRVRVHRTAVRKTLLWVRRIQPFYKLQHQVLFCIVVDKKFSPCFSLSENCISLIELLKFNREVWRMKKRVSVVLSNKAFRQEVRKGPIGLFKKKKDKSRSVIKKYSPGIIRDEQGRGYVIKEWSPHI